jgi:ubiquinone/menaquinone biosynthesis C-methylase UbiE
MAKETRGVSLDYLSDYYDVLTPAERSRIRQKQIELIGLDIAFQVASIDELPYPDGYFDLVISSLMLHHLPMEIKRKGLGEVHRVLKGDGRFFLCDFCSPHPLTIIPMYLMMIWRPYTRYQLFGKLPDLIRESGFAKIRLLKKGLFLEYYLIEKAGGDG